MKTYIEEILTTFSDFHQTFFSFLTAYSLQQLFSQLTATFFHSHSPTKQTLNVVVIFCLRIAQPQLSAEWTKTIDVLEAGEASPCLTSAGPGGLCWRGTFRNNPKQMVELNV
jgi:hypothetical protein